MTTTNQSLLLKIIYSIKIRKGHQAILPLQNHCPYGQYNISEIKYTLKNIQIRYGIPRGSILSRNKIPIRRHPAQNISACHVSGKTYQQPPKHPEQNISRIGILFLLNILPRGMP